ncbi:RNA polymerase Rpc34 subunit-domain-containing protein [Ganoderma leucocontextum]|nr:RNA polymerase Rpc34 subunit-domain-containing protein [Ganoderma leucocontextum]
MSHRPLNALERKLHQAAFAKPDKILSQKEIDSLGADPAERTSAINFLLGTGLFVVLAGQGSRILYRAVSQDVLEVKKGLGQEETLVLDRIRAAGNQGLWTKHIKGQTQLHQTLVDKCLKSLTQKQLIKTVNDVRYSTRKIYMLAHLEPSVELTGGPWYTDKELDTEFIKLLSDVCLKIVRDRNFPKAVQGEDTSVRRLYPLAHSSYPTAPQILELIRKSRVTETELTVHHAEMLLEVLILDGRIEKIPAFNIPEPAWDEDPGSEGDARLSKKAPKRKRRRDRNDDSDSSIDTEVDRTAADSENDMSTSDDNRPRKRRRRHHKSHSDDELESRRKRKGRKKSVSSSSDTEDEDDPAEEGLLEPSGGQNIVARKSRKTAGPEIGGTRDTQWLTSRFAYRAVRDERVTSGLNQTPCVVCPVYNFCRDGGPVSPQQCAFYEAWLQPGGKSLE